MKKNEVNIEDVFYHSQERDVISFYVNGHAKIEGMLMKLQGLDHSKDILVEVKGYDTGFILPWGKQVTLVEPELGDQECPIDFTPETYQIGFINKWCRLYQGNELRETGLLKKYLAMHKPVMLQGKSKICVAQEWTFESGKIVTVESYI